MKVLLWVLLILTSPAACPCLAQNTNEPPRRLDLGALTNGMTFAAFQAAVGEAGEMLPQPSEGEAHYIFDLDGKYLVASVRTDPQPSIINRFWVREDGRTAKQRREERQLSISRAVVRPHMRRTNAVQASEAIGAPGAPQPQR